MDPFWGKRRDGHGSKRWLEPKDNTHKMMNHKIALVVGLYFLWAAGLGAQSGLLAIEDARFEAQVARDTVRLRQLLADDLVYIHSNALTESKSDFIHSVGSGRIVYQRMQAEAGRRIRTSGRRIAIVDGTAQVTGLFQSNAFEMKLRYTASYRKHRGQWQLWSWQSTRINN